LKFMDRITKNIKLIEVQIGNRHMIKATNIIVTEATKVSSQPCVQVG
jgi:hypothetical protein